jgi:transcription termination/antitermination protein NusA
MDAIQESAVAWLMSTLGIGRSTAWSLVYEGLATLEEIAYVPLDELLETGCSEEELQLARIRARELLVTEGGTTPGPFG